MNEIKMEDMVQKTITNLERRSDETLKLLKLNNEERIEVIESLNVSKGFCDTLDNMKINMKSKVRLITKLAEEIYVLSAKLDKHDNVDECSFPTFFIFKSMTQIIKWESCKK